MLKGVKGLDGVIVSGIRHNADLKILDLKGWNRKIRQRDKCKSIE